MIHKFKYEVIQIHEVDVEIDDVSVNEQFMAEFRESFYPYHTPTEHAEHLAQLAARNMIDPDGFVEGYGHINGTKGEPSVKVTVKVADESIEFEQISYIEQP